MIKKKRKTKIILILMCYLSFVLYSIYFNGFGVNVSTIMAFFQINKAQSGLIITLQSIGAIILTVILGLYGERINKLHGIAFGLVIMGLAGIVIGLIPSFFSQGSGYYFMLGFSLLAGIGYIIVDLLMNGVIADIFPHKKDSLLPYVHAFYCAGAMLAPLFITAVVNPDKISTFALPYIIIGSASIAACVVFAIASKKIMPETPYANMKEISSRAKANPAEIFRDPRAWMYLLACFFYVSFQTGMSTWLPTFCSEHLHIKHETAGLMVTMYFLGALAMRFISPTIYKHITVRKFYIVSLIISGLLFPIFIFVQMPVYLNMILIVIVGLLQGSSVPALIILCCDAFPARTASASSIVVLGLSLAALIIPTVVGNLIETSGYTLPMLILNGSIFLSVLILIPIKSMKKA